MNERKGGFLFEKLKSSAHGSKDRLTAMTIKKIVNNRLKKRVPGARLEKLVIDSQKKNIRVTLTLPELPEPITIRALSYSITEKNGHHFLEVKEIQKSQDWSNHYIDGKRYKIPPRILKVAEAIL